jgi:hypothetical protein
MSETPVLDPALAVLEGIELSGDVNTSDEQLITHIAHAIRLGYPQIKPQPLQKDRVLLVGGGPSLDATFDELRDLYFAGAKLVTVNGSYRWCVERNLRPSLQIVLDARAENARFLDPALPHCHYALASQCHPDTWAAVAQHPHVWIWHAMHGDNAHRAVLDQFYAGNWHGIAGGTTVIMRALSLLRTLGYLRFDLFGVDSCYLDGQHHAYAQAENDRDRRVPVMVHPTGHPEQARRFWCAPWHLKQLECFLQTIRINGSQFLLNVHGDGLLAFALQASADVAMSVDAAATQGDSSGRES